MMSEANQGSHNDGATDSTTNGTNTNTNTNTNSMFEIPPFATETETETGTDTGTDIALSNSNNNHAASASDLLFFADATLDLTLAHDIADTPDATQQHHRRRGLAAGIAAGAAAAGGISSGLPITGNDGSNTNSHIMQLLPPLPFSTPSNSNAGNTNTSGIATEVTTTTIPTFVVPVNNNQDLPQTPVDETSGTNTGASIVQMQLDPLMNKTTTATSTSTTTDDNNNNNNNHNITATTTTTATSTTHTTTATRNTYPTNRIIPPKYPRDIGPVVLFLIVVPISLLHPIFTMTTINVLGHPPLSFATIHAITWTILVGAILVRVIYWNRTPSISTMIMTTTTSTTDSHTLAAPRRNMAVLLTALAPVSMVVYGGLFWTILYIYFLMPDRSQSSVWIVLLPFYLLAREIYIYRHYLTRHTEHINEMGYVSRITFFHELYHMSVTEILLGKSKLQHRRTMRIVSGILILQCLTILTWRSSLLHILAHNNNNTQTKSFASKIHVLYIILIGIWCTSCLTKCITYLVSGAILLWSMEQSERLEQLQDQQQQQHSNYHISNVSTSNGGIGASATTGSAVDHQEEDEDDVSSILSRQSIPEAYRTVDASVYQSVSFQMDDLQLDDDDFDDDDDDDDHLNYNSNSIDVEANQRRMNQNQPSYMFLNGNGRNRSQRLTSTTMPNLHQHTNISASITMKSMIRMGVRMNLGSIIYCGMISPLSQWIHTHMQYIDFIRQQRQQYRQQQSIHNSGSSGGFQGMRIGQAGDSSTTPYRIAMIVSMLRRMAQYYNDLPMSHVATYYKSYIRATRDVTLIIQESGTLIVCL